MQIQYLATLCLLLLLACPAGAAEPAEGEPAEGEPLITLDLKDRNLESVVEALAVVSGRRFLLTADIDPKAAAPGIALTEVPLSIAIETIAAVYGVCSVARPGITSFQSCSSAPATGKVLLGVSLVTMTPESAYERGGIVTSVLPDSVAARAGIQPEDRIIAFDGRTILRASNLVDAVSRVAPGALVAVELVRGKQRVRVTAQF